MSKRTVLDQLRDAKTEAERKRLIEKLKKQDLRYLRVPPPNPKREAHEDAGRD